MGMTVVSRIEDATIIAMSGKWMGTKEEVQLIEAVKSELQGGKIKRIILDLAQVEWSNSYGIGALAATFTSATNANAKMALANVPPALKKVLDICFLSKVFTICPSIHEALLVTAQD